MGQKLKKILISGASSDIGIGVIINLLRSNYKVDALYNENGEKLNTIAKKNKRLKLYKINFENNDIESYNFTNIDCYLSLQGYLENSVIEKIDEESLIKHIKINYIKNLIIIEKILPYMRKKKYGKIFLTTSVGTKFGGSNSSLYYSISKHLNEYHPSYLRKLIKYNISINTISLGLTDTKIHKKIKGKDLRKRINLTPAKRIISVNEISEALSEIITMKNNILSNQLINLTNGE
jgi:short-subunit dehydrogenase